MEEEAAVAAQDRAEDERAAGSMDGCSGMQLFEDSQSGGESIETAGERGLGIAEERKIGLLGGGEGLW